ncbi:hypothetical protein D3C83_47230 [compost metagenome]
MKALRQKEKAARDHADDADDDARIFEKREKAHDESLSEAAAHNGIESERSRLLTGTAR